MAMLAEPRRRQKLSSDPRNKSWSDDSTKFGQRLMEKMGWSKGRGLGANEDGNLEHVKVSLKNNNLGVGCSARHEDNWIAHQDDFNDILASLGHDHTSSTLPGDDAEQESQSLEQRSKKSRKRVHYKKFTKGKDLTTYGKDGMNSILGKRLAHSAPVTPQSQSVENSDEEKDEENPEDTSHGVVTVKSSCSVSEYFAKKMADLKNSRRRLESESHSDGEVETTRSGFGFYPPEFKGHEEEEGRMGFGFKPQREKPASDVSKFGLRFVAGQSSTDALVGTTKSSDKSSESICVLHDKNDEEEVEVASERRDGKRKKKRKRRKDRVANIEDDVDRVNEEQQGVRIEVNGNDDEDEGIELERKKKKNKKKRKLVDESMESKSSDSASQQDEVAVSVEKKKKKKTKKSKKDKSRNEEDRATCSNDSDELVRGAGEDCETADGAKKRKAASLEGENEEEDWDHGETNSCKKKRKKDKLAKEQVSVRVEERKCPSIKKKRKKNRKQGDV